MTNRLIIAVMAGLLWMPEVSGQSILQRSDWKERGLETYLPPLEPTVPWLNLNTKTKLPKVDLPLGRDTASAGPFILPSIGADTQVSSNASSASRSM
ncbi:hypothetical protein [Rhodoplanes sp. Z2-YC6860]|uniref:hypothetical protein n=1 Tax=Rhodoplanes sp. Z2-YC6860 TaxID=674703 RepID=UPI00082E674B|nr:hypothetical protein [Rhodoplanes sp. Z2-YC6860]